jgi:hypothetical protein
MAGATRCPGPRSGGPLPNDRKLRAYVTWLCYMHVGSYASTPARGHCARVEPAWVILFEPNQQGDQRGLRTFAPTGLRPEARAGAACTLHGRRVRLRACCALQHGTIQCLAVWLILLPCIWGFNCAAAANNHVQGPCPIMLQCTPSIAPAHGMSDTRYRRYLPFAVRAPGALALNVIIAPPCPGPGLKSRTVSGPAW